MRSKKEILTRLKSCKRIIQQYESISNTIVSERIIKKYELKFKLLAWCLGYGTEEERNSLYDSL